MFATLLAALPEAVRGLLRGLGEAVLPRFVAGVGLVGHGLMQSESARGGSVLGLRNVSRARVGRRALSRSDPVTVAASLETSASPRG